MAAFTTTPTEAGEGPSVLGIAAAIGAKIRDAAENAKEEREKAREAGETPKKGSLFKSSLANQFNPIKSKKAKSNWAKQFSWNKPKDKPVTPPTEGDSANGSANLKEFIAGGFTAILKDTGMMVAKLGGIGDGIGQNLSATNRSASTLTVIKETLDAQTDLRRKALEEAKYARAEKQLEKTQDTSSSRSPLDATEKGKSDGEGGDGDGGGGPWDWILGALGIADLLDNFLPGLNKLNPFKKSPVTQGKGGKPSGPRMPGTGPKVTTSGGAPAPAAKQPWWKKMLPFADDAAKGATGAGAKGAGGLLGRILPGAQTALGIGLAAKSFSEGDIIGGALNLGSALPGPLGWGFLAAGLGRDLLGKDMVDNAFGQAMGGFGTADANTQKLMSGKSATENALLGLTTSVSYSGLSQGGIVPSAIPLARGGIVDNPTKTNLNPGDSVIPLNRNVGKQMFGGANDTSAGETAVDTVGAMILGVSSGMLGKTESGTAGDAVKQDIRKAAKEFGISNLTFTSSIGKGKFGVVDTNKDAKDFMSSLFSGIKIAGSGKDKGKGGGGGGNETPEAGSVAEQATQMTGKTASEAASFMDEQDKVLTKAGIPNAIYGSESVQGDVIDEAWCASFVAAVLSKKGYKPPNSALADAYAPGKWGETIDPKEAKPGDIITFDYSGQKKEGYHVAVVKSNDGKTITYVGGNQGGGGSRNSKVTEGSISVNDSTLLGITRPKETLNISSSPQAKDAKETADGIASSIPSAPASQGGALPEGNVTQIAQRGMIGKAQDGMVGKKEPAWWDIGGRINNWLDNSRENATIGGNKFGGDRYKQQMKELGYAKGGKSDVMKANAAKLKAKRASEQRSRLGVQKVNGKWVNMGVSDRAVGSNPWWQVWNKKGATAERKAKQEALAKSLADRLNKQEAAKTKPQAAKPRPSAPASPAAGVRPTPSASTSGSQAATIVTPPVSSSSSKSFSAGGYGGNVPQGRSMASTFADFLYADLIE